MVQHKVSFPRRQLLLLTRTWIQTTREKMSHSRRSTLDYFFREFCFVFVGKQYKYNVHLQASWLACQLPRILHQGPRRDKPKHQVWRIQNGRTSGLWPLRVSCFLPQRGRGFISSVRPVRLDMQFIPTEVKGERPPAAAAGGPVTLRGHTDRPLDLRLTRPSVISKVQVTQSTANKQKYPWTWMRLRVWYPSESTWLLSLFSNPWFYTRLVDLPACRSSKTRVLV